MADRKERDNNIETTEIPQLCLSFGREKGERERLTTFLYLPGHGVLWQDTNFIFVYVVELFYFQSFPLADTFEFRIF